ncbi:DUF3846 domain-containing protein [Streptomyces sp. CBG9]|uniref:DUF3846 domain-containing protein n=1 Tax=Streptomyces sp. CBG9 TaxID=2762622 RepID=UPI0016481CFC|nr:DUF3846 domain-containing protein [Streptomyces sp. CBG9]
MYQTTPNAILLTSDGCIVPINLPETAQDRQTVMRSVIRCSTYGYVALTSNLDMWLDGEDYRHPLNPLATTLARRFGFDWQNYHGPVLITGGADQEGTTLPIHENRFATLLTSLQSL